MNNIMIHEEEGQIEGHDEDLNTHGQEEPEPEEGQQQQEGGDAELTTLSTMQNNHNSTTTTVMLCASCDRCRARKTKCDGQRPCGSCVARYLKKRRLTSMDGIDPAECDCVYSPAKRRGPVPGGKGCSGYFRRRIRDCDICTHSGTVVSSSVCVVDSTLDNNNTTTTTTPTLSLSSSSSSCTNLNHLSLNLNQHMSNIPNAQPPPSPPPPPPPPPALESATTSWFSSNCSRSSSHYGDHHHYLPVAITQAQGGGLESSSVLSPWATAAVGGGVTMDAQQAMAHLFPGVVGSAAIMGQHHHNQQQFQQHHQGPILHDRMGIHHPLPLPQQLSRQPQPQQRMIGISRPIEATDMNQRMVENSMPPSRRIKRDNHHNHINSVGADFIPASSSNNSTAGSSSCSNIPTTIMNHTHLLNGRDPDGSRLYAYYKLSVDELFRLPPTPTDEEYCSRVLPGVPPQHMPSTHWAALSAARFAELALGALVHHELVIAMELCNAVVHCLRETAAICGMVGGDVTWFEIGKAYFLLGVFRAFRGDLDRYLKYRRLCLSYLSRSHDEERTLVMIGAMSYLDAWTYMICNGNERSLPNIDDALPAPVSSSMRGEDDIIFPNATSTNTTDKNGVCSSSCNCSSRTTPNDHPFSSNSSMKPNHHHNNNYDNSNIRSIVCDPTNKFWIQGAPLVYLNRAAPAQARVLDGVACSIRACCDLANHRFAAIQSNGHDHGGGSSSSSSSISSSSTTLPVPSHAHTHTHTHTHEGDTTPITCTTSAIMSHGTELCSRNVILTSCNLIQQQGCSAYQGLQLVITALDAFLENSEENQEETDDANGFTDSQIQSLLWVCNTVLENPLLLHHAGPTYHIVTNAAILLCHFVNGMYGFQQVRKFGTVERTLLEEVLDTLHPIRKLLMNHRQKLPINLRCHGIPRIPTGSSLEDTTIHCDYDPPSSSSLIHLHETVLCPCRACQGFVLMACSPCVSAERARAVESRIQKLERATKEREYLAAASSAMVVTANANNTSHHHNTHTYTHTATTTTTATATASTTATAATTAAVTADTVESFYTTSPLDTEFDDSDELDDLSAQFDLDDDALIGMISTLIYI